MQPYIVQFIMFIAGFMVFNHFRLGLRYYCLFCLPFYSMPLLQVSLGSTVITSVQLMSLVVLGWMVMTSQPLSKQALLKVTLILSPFFISLLYNTFFFTPVYGYAYDRAADGGGLIVLKESLTSTNFTQMIYIIFAGFIFLIFSSIPLDKIKVKKVIELSMIAVASIGIFQVIAWYGGFNFVYKALFSTLPGKMADQTFPLWGLKRISSTFPESSYFGHYLFFTLTYYLHAFGYREFLKSRAVMLLLVVGVFSTSTTGYLGIAILIALLYVFYSKPDEKMYYYIAFLLIGPLVVYFGWQFVADYLNAKSSSTDQRMYISWTLALDGIQKSPIFGHAYGTSRPLFIHTQLIHAIGVFGLLIFLFGVLYGNIKGRAVNRYLLGLALIGMANFELGRPEMWAYFGLLTNQSLRNSRFDRPLQPPPRSRMQIAQPY